MLKNRSLSIWLVLAFLLGAAALIAVPAISATSKGMGDWRTAHPNSNSDDAGCQLCHGSSTGQLNSYGRDICLEFEKNGKVPSDWSATFEAIAALDSDLDPNGISNSVEIANDAQPGWTTAANPLYVADFAQGCVEVAADSTVPNSVPLPYDVAIAEDPTANPGGPYEALVGETIIFDGSGSTDNGTIVRYDWVFGDGTSAPDAGPSPEYAYAEEGIYNVILTVTDNDGNSNAAATTAFISPVELLDLDIAELSVSRTARVGKAFPIKLKVENNGTVLGQAIATVVGTQEGSGEVYRLRLNVFDNIGKGTTTFKFGSYMPTAKGTINWTATIDDADPDVDLATAATVVK